jgi:hypothetical protein
MLGSFSRYGNFGNFGEAFRARDEILKGSFRKG